jgi:hypothetical protein
MSKIRSGVIAAIAAVTGISASAMTVGLALAPPAGAAPKPSATWHTSLRVSTANFPEFSALTSWSADRAWAFIDGTSGTRPVAYELTGGSWRRESFPGLIGEQVWSATSSSASNVWAFTVAATSKERVLHFDGRSWSVVPTSGKLINSGLALSSKDVWIFGSKFGPSTGTVHYDGKTFTHFASGAGLFGGSALSPSNIWAYGVDKVAHWNGHTWKSTRMSLLSTACGHPGFLEGILAISSSDVLAVGSGGCTDNRGPLILLRFNGSSWHRLTFTKPIDALALTIIGDGSRGAWIPVNVGEPNPVSSLYHFTGRAISKAKLPAGSKGLELDGATIAGGTGKALAFGLTRNSSNTRWNAVVLRFES